MNHFIWAMLMYSEAQSHVDVQQQLIVEEGKDISTHGQAHWIASGIKIQELQSVH